MKLIEKLNVLRTAGGKARTVGLDDATIERFATRYPELGAAVDAAVERFHQIKAEFADVVAMDEDAQMAAAQEGFVNFYAEDNVNPYLAIAARGPWLITLKGAVIHDSGGYGMLGFGHAPQAVLDAMSQPHVMANVMTPSLSQLRLTRALRKEIGHSVGGCPYTKFLCLNSGSESVSLAGRIADVNTKLMTDPGAPHAGWKVKRIAIKGAFHGRTELPMLYSDSTRKAYATHLASFKHHEHTIITIEPYDVDALHKAFEDAARDHVHIEAMFLEPVMGEGNPGRAVPRAFYAAARELTKQHHTLLLMDSIQAGLRTTGNLSVVDNPEYAGLEAPDMETYSKALNAGQYPLSVLAVNDRAEHLYRKGIYGNTMTTNPRAMDVASTVLDALTPELRANIQNRGREFVEKLEALARELPGMISNVQGTGLLFSAELSKDFKCYGTGSTEEYLREHGYGVIHGGTNSLRFTPPFTITGDEVDLIIAGVRDALLNGPRIAIETPKAAAA
ncbi:MAG TPA: aminotransferase class III-fold pyridoxal phosphate-dependent enzyme [Patescibacteria group bacterium]|nr:aminotransferase class III-fold pyridoxal phosphate-dependent enzyme [Patescibacteria group bacterium]